MPANWVIYHLTSIFLTFPRRAKLAYTLYHNKLLKTRISQPLKFLEHPEGLTATQHGDSEEKHQPNQSIYKQQILANVTKLFNPSIPAKKTN